MTIIAATSFGKQTFICGDQAGTDGWGTQAAHGTKLYETPFGWLGYTASYRTIQVIHRQLRTVERLRNAEDECRLIEAIEIAMVGAGWSKTNADKLPKCADLNLLIATWEGRLYTVQSDLALLRSRHFAAIGSGYQVALGAMHAAKVCGSNPEIAVRLGVRAACDIISTCAKPVQPVHVR